MVDYEDRAGYGKDAIIAAFTVLGTQNTDPAKPGYPSGGQFLAASMDDGATFYRFPMRPPSPPRTARAGGIPASSAMRTTM